MRRSLPTESDQEPPWPLIVLPTGEAPGLGVLVAPHQMVTCAHILDPQRRDKVPDTEVSIASLFRTATGLASGKVVGWAPREDLALIELTVPMSAADLPRLRYTERLGAGTEQHRWSAWAFPRSVVGSRMVGADVGEMLAVLRAGVRFGSGTIVGYVGRHRYQIVTDGDPALESGYSGAPVRDASLGCVIGILTSRAAVNSDPVSRTGFLVTTEGIAEAFPAVRRWIGWHFETDSSLRAAWRYEDASLQRPSLGSFFTGRRTALDALTRTIADQEEAP